MLKLIFYFTYFLGIVMYANEVDTKEQVTRDKRIDYTTYRCTSRLIVHTVPQGQRGNLRVSYGTCEFIEAVVKRKFNFCDMCLFFYQMFEVSPIPCITSTKQAFQNIAIAIVTTTSPQSPSTKSFVDTHRRRILSCLFSLTSTLNHSVSIFSIIFPG